LKYLKAYLDIMRQNPYFELIYFDGFAGSGEIKPNTKYGLILESVALKVVTFEHRHSFNMYYLVDKNKQKIESLESKIKNHPISNSRKIYCIAGDANDKLKSLVTYMHENPKNRRALVLIDPYGMQVNWEDIAQCKDLGIDVWVLVPTGIGINRMLVKDGNIDEIWLKKLSQFLGMSENEVKNYFYKETIENTLFGEDTKILKESNAAERAAALYVERLKTIWKVVSKPFPMKVPDKNTVLYHFIFASNNHTGLKIANDIIGKQLNE
jgi:three-Cys-motif partner protein